MHRIVEQLSYRFSPDVIGAYLSRVVPELIAAVATFLVFF